MDRIGAALAAGQHVLFEGACGTGKTLAALSPAIAYARSTDATVVICTNVNQQARQFIREARALRTAVDPPLRAAVFRGKGDLCHIDVGYEECRVLRENTRAAADGELVPEDRQCSYYRGTLAADDAAFFSWLADDIRTPEDVYAYADRRSECGYELLKAVMADVELVICNYNHLLDPHIRPAFFRWLDRDSEDVVAIIDEAHNVPSAAREYGTRTLTERTLTGSLEELSDHADPRSDRVHHLLASFHRALESTTQEALAEDESPVGEDWNDLAVRTDDEGDRLRRAFHRAYDGDGLTEDLRTANDLGRDLDSEYEEAYRRGETETREESPTLIAARFVDGYLATSDDPEYHPMAGIRRDGTTLHRRVERYAAIPRPVTAELFDDLRSAILMSATLRPFDVLADTLGLRDPVTMAYDLTFPPTHRQTFTVATPPLFASQRDRPEVQETVGSAVVDAVTYAAGNVLCFFPSYAEAERYHERVGTVCPGETFLDGPGVDSDTLRTEFTAAESGTLFTSIWGTFTEGVSFDGDDATTAVIIGVPYPHLDDRRAAVQSAFATAFADRTDVEDPGWRYAVEAPTVRKVRQAMGRVVRGPDEIGSRILLDRRYCAEAQNDLGRYSVFRTFPESVRTGFVDVSPERLRFALSNFFRSHDAYPGTPPDPATGSDGE